MTDPVERVPTEELPEEEEEKMEKTISAAVEAVFAILEHGIDSAISEYNGFRGE